MKKQILFLIIFLFSGSHVYSESSFKVALLLTGPVTDGGWNASAYDGLKLIQKELGAKISHVETRTPLEFEEGFREFAKLGFDLVIGHGFEFQDAALKMGKRYPKTVFLVSAGNKTNGKNVGPVQFNLGEGAYLLGLLAGDLSKTATVGMIGGMALPPVKEAFEGFRQGFLKKRPEGKVLEAYLGSWEDVNGAKEAALAQINQGADLIIHNADAAGWGVVQASREKGTYVFGTNKDQTTFAPEVILACAVCDIPKVFLNTALQVRDKKFVPHEKPYGLKEKGVWLAINPKLKTLVPAAAFDEVKKETQYLINGETLP